MSAAVSASSSTALLADDRKYLLFRVGAERYGIDVMKVRKIIGPTPTTPLPNVPPHVRGVINLRGKAVPIIDLGVLFGSSRPGPDGRRLAVVVDLGGGEREALAGLSADEVTEVRAALEETFEESPRTDAEGRRPLIRGLARLPDGIASLLAVEALLDRRAE